MQPQQADQQQNQRQSSVGDAVELPVNLLAEPEAVSGIMDGVGHYAVKGAELLLDGISLVCELIGELLSGLGS